MKTNRSLVKPSDAGGRARARGRHCRELTVAEWRELYGNCERYATAWFARYGMPLCDLEDTIVDAALDAYERVRRRSRGRGGKG